ncbi:MAG: hypothetical protein Kow00124_01410 [Anaerolineae bacterium]
MSLVYPPQTTLNLVCAACGHRLEAAGWYPRLRCPHCGAPGRPDRSGQHLLPLGWECDTCGSHNEGLACFCLSCGSGLASRCSRCGFPVYTAICGKCGTHQAHLRHIQHIQQQRAAQRRAITTLQGEGPARHAAISPTPDRATRRGSLLRWSWGWLYIILGAALLAATLLVGLIRAAGLPLTDLLNRLLAAAGERLTAALVWITGARVGGLPLLPFFGIGAASLAILLLYLIFRAPRDPGR